MICGRWHMNHLAREPEGARVGARLAQHLQDHPRSALLLPRCLPFESSARKAAAAVLAVSILCLGICICDGLQQEGRKKRIDERTVFFCTLLSIFLRL